MYPKYTAPPTTASPLGKSHESSESHRLLLQMQSREAAASSIRSQNQPAYLQVILLAGIPFLCPFIFSIPLHIHIQSPTLCFRLQVKLFILSVYFWQFPEEHVILFSLRWSEGVEKTFFPSFFQVCEKNEFTCADSHTCPALRLSAADNMGEMLLMIHALQIIYVTNVFVTW